MELFRASVQREVPSALWTSLCDKPDAFWEAVQSAVMGKRSPGGVAPLLEQALVQRMRPGIVRDMHHFMSGPVADAVRRASRDIKRPFLSALTPAEYTTLCSPMFLGVGPFVASELALADAYPMRADLWLSETGVKALCTRLAPYLKPCAWEQFAPVRTLKAWPSLFFWDHEGDDIIYDRILTGILEQALLTCRDDADRFHVLCFLYYNKAVPAKVRCMVIGPVLARLHYTRWVPTDAMNRRQFIQGSDNYRYVWAILGQLGLESPSTRLWANTIDNVDKLTFLEYFVHQMNTQALDEAPAATVLETFLKHIVVENSASIMMRRLLAYAEPDPSPRVV